MMSESLGGNQYRTSSHFPSLNEFPAKPTVPPIFFRSANKDDTGAGALWD